MTRASVRVEGQVTGAIENGLLLLVGVESGDTGEDVSRAVAKVAGLRVFPDDRGLMNLSLADVGGSALVVSQFTLLADVRKGRRPSFVAAAGPETASPLLDRLVAELIEAGVPTQTGVFGAKMEVELVNDGPVTLVLDVRGGQVL